MSDEKDSLPLCDPETGICESGAKMQTEEKQMRVIYFTDPICSSCWMIEPQIRKLEVEYRDHLTIEYHMGGLLSSWDMFTSGPITKPSDVAHHWDDMSTRFGMPIDGEVWLTDPLPSSYPPCKAYKAAELQGQKKAAHFLRRIREMVMVDKKNIARIENLQQAAMESGMDTPKLLADYESRSEELFKKDLELCAHYRVRGFPSIFFTNSEADQVLVHGFRPYEDYEAAIKKLAPSIEKKQAPSAKELFDCYPTLTTKEFSVIKSVSMTDAEQILSELAKSRAIEKQSVKNGVLWKKAHVN